MLSFGAMAAPLIGNPSMADALAGQHSTRRLGEGADGVGLADVLPSAGAGWITGQIFAVDGGRSTVRMRG